jgi:hypothetical protein
MLPRRKRNPGDSSGDKRNLPGIMNIRLSIFYFNSVKFVRQADRSRLLQEIKDSFKFRTFIKKNVISLFASDS